MSISEPSKIVPLTSARFFAALYVVLYHGIPNLPSQRDRHDLFARIISLGYVSVSFFFMLSGFILAIVYLKDNRSVNRRKFLISRFARVYPLYLAAVLLDVPHFVHAQWHISPEHTIASILATIGLVQAWYPSLVGPDFPSWSLSTEAFFYLIFPFLGLALWRLRGSTTVWSSAMIYVGGVWIVDMLDEVRTSASTRLYHPLPHLFVFLLGINLAKLFAWISRRPEHLRILQGMAPWMLLGSLAAFLAIPILELRIPEMLLQHGLLAPLFALFILAFASENRWISYLFSSSWMEVLGEASFAFYLINVPIGELLRRWMERYEAPMFGVYVGVSLGLSIASLKFLETPARNWILSRERVRSPETKFTSAIAQ